MNRWGAAVILLLVAVTVAVTGEEKEVLDNDIKEAKDVLLKEEGEEVNEGGEPRHLTPCEAKRRKEEGTAQVKKEEVRKGTKKQQNKGEKRRKNDKVTQKKKKKKTVKVRKACPGRCADAAKLCKSGRVTKAADCGEGVCCLQAKRTKEDGDLKLQKHCRSRPLCTDHSGTCQSKSIPCPPGYTALRNSKGKKYCKGKKCVCCAKDHGECTTKSKCSRKKGYCTKDASSCHGRFKQSKAFCSGADCVCCLPSKCKTRPGCEAKKGTCGNLNTMKCSTEPLVGKQYCKGKGCGCCPNEEGGGGPEWGYTEENGPATWPAKFPTCAGKRQSPVALKSKEAEGTYPWIPFKFENYGQVPKSSLLINNGHTAMVEVTQDETPAVLGGDLEGGYTFLQLHFHWGKDKSEGSEHTIDGKSFPGELHIVHYKTSYGSVEEAANHDDGIAVLGIMLEVSHEDNRNLNPIIDNLVKIHEADTETHISPFPLQNLLPKNVDDFFRYEGSLTTPTCNEIVIWTVFKDTITISHKQLSKFRFLMDEEGNLLIENFRPVQPLNGRKVYMGRTSPYWSYISPFDSPNWPNFFPTCGSTVRQSPIALNSKKAIGIYPRLTLGFKNYDIIPNSMTILNNGHTAQVMTTLPGGAEASIKGGDLDGKYVVLQFHFHWGATDKLGSEHTIDGDRFPLELHIVHYKASYGSVANAANFDDGIAVLGIMFSVSKDDNSRIQSIIDGLAKIHEAEEEAHLTPFPLSNLLPADTDNFFRYEGSLTTPTCNEIVIWTVFRNAVEISSKQLAEFRKLMDEGGMILQDNFRVLQPLSGREVLISSLKRHWSYVGATGPDNWAKIFPTCKGNRQSPIALASASAVSTTFTPFVFTNYDTVPTKMTIMNNGHTAQIGLESNAIPHFSGGGLDDYTFLQFHFHWGRDDTAGAEHTIDDRRFPAELHIVHFKTSYGTIAEAANHADGVAVLGIMLETSNNDNPNLRHIIEGLSKIHVADTEDDIAPFTLESLLPGNTRDFFRYEGSLTTPTCNEIVIWTVFKNTIKISKRQLAEFRALEDESGLSLVDNFRPVQPLAGRTVSMS